jgi:hypothetical protein
MYGRASAIAVAVALFAMPVCAQTDNRPEFSAGYVALNDPSTETTFSRGWIAGAALPIHRSLFVTGEAGGSYAFVPGFGSPTRLHVHSVMGGLRAAGPLGPFLEFVQVVAGLTRAGGSRFGVSENRNAFAVQPGAGVDLPLGHSFALRGEVDVRFIRSTGGGNAASHQVRFVGAAVFHP